MKLRYRISAHSEVDTFIARYDEYFVALYRDTGVWSEANMIRDARAKTDQLFTDIYDTIDRHLGNRAVMGRKKIHLDTYELLFYVGSRLVVVYYSEERRENIRWIESISIGREPIIF